MKRDKQRLEERAISLQTELNKRPNGENIEEFVLRKAKELFISRATIYADLKKDVELKKA